MPASIAINLASQSTISPPRTRTPAIFIALPLLALLVALLVAAHEKGPADDDIVAIVQSVGL